jgi:hypothetical protein
MAGACTSSPGRSTTTSARPSTSTGPAGPRTILNQQGSGYTNTGFFTVPGNSKEWDLAWSFNCPANTPPPTGYQVGNFAFLVYKGTAEDLNDKGILEPTNSGQGTQQYADTGRFSIRLGALTVCTWTVTVTLPAG